MSDELRGRTIAFLVAPEGVEQVELTRPWEAVKHAGGTPRLLTTKPGDIQAFNHLDRAGTFAPDGVVADADPAHYDAVVLPGGVANPDLLRTNHDAVRFVAAAAERGTPIAAICHGPWTLVEAGVVTGRRMTSWPSLKTDLRNAGADWVDEEVVVDNKGPGPLVSSRKPQDLSAFCRELVAVAAA